MSRSTKLALLALIPLALSGCGYNNIQRYDEQAAQAKQQIDVQLQRRADLVPNLVATVKGYAKQEETIFIEVARARSGLVSAIQSGDPSEAAAANAQLTGALSRLLVTVEAYPQLKSDQNFLRLQDELSGTENRIATARTDYNAAVSAYNTYIRTLPQKLTAMVTGAKPREYFDAPQGTAAPPQVDFSRP
ncbi:MAG TPA: LemA family protein [Gemmatimonadaceae bacterium]|nr:LemA family protein [Gemmatimonadaceae bacterium]